MAGPILALVGLLLAFSFSMAADRLALRRTAIVQEANSIGSLWLHTALVPEPTRSALEAEAERLQQELWGLMMEDVRRAPEASRVRVVVPVLGAMLDATANVLAARENRLPDAIYLYLFLLVIVAGVVIGYQPAGAKRNLILWVLFTFVVSGVLVILLDIDRPRRGMIQSEVAPYLRLRESMRVPPPGGP